MTPFANPADRVSPIPEHAEAAARLLTQAARRIRNGQNVRDVCEGLVDVVIALSGRI